MQNKNSIHLHFTLDEVNTILTALGKQPYVEVFEMIQKIQQQAMAQTGTEQKENGVVPDELNIEQ